MKFLHISDLHFDPINDGEETTLLREKFITYLVEKEIVVDEIFFTGDFRHAMRQKDQQEDEIIENACDFLIAIAQHVVKDTDNIYKHIHIVPGNHDLIRGDIGILNKIYEEYDPYNANFMERLPNGQTALSVLLYRFSFFRKCAEYLENDIWKDFMNDICPVRVMDEYSIVYANTAIASGREIDRGHLYIGRKYIGDAFRKVKKINGEKPIIVLAHNNIDDIEEEERRKLKMFFEDCGMPIIWLCGDAHETGFDNSYNGAYITVGCLLQEKGTKSAFFIGELTSGGIEFQAYGYDSENSGWEYKERLTKRINNSVPEALKPRKKKLVFQNNLRRQNKYFTGREAALNRIDELFRQRNSGVEKGVKTVNICQTISGLGGVGKTQLAIEYGYRFGGNYEDAVWFVTADSQASIYNSFLEFAKEYKIKITENCNAAELQTAVQWRLNDHEKWLLIIDNLENLYDLEPYLSNTLQGYLLITTRNTHIDLGEKYALDVFSKDEAVDFLRKRISAVGNTKEYEFDDFKDKAPLLAKRLGYLPLALEQAGAYISIVKCSLSEYLDLLEEYGLDVFDNEEKYSRPQDYEKVISTTWNISIACISDKGAKQLFRLCSYMDSEKIPVQFFVEIRDKLMQPLSDELSNKQLTNRIVTQLREYSLTSGNADYITIHRLVQEVVRMEISDEKIWLESCYQGMRIYLPNDFEQREQREKFQKISNHCDSVFKYYGDEKEDAEYSDDIFNLGYAYYLTGIYKKACEWLDKALKIRENLKDILPEKLVSSNHYVGLAYFYNSQYGEAKNYYRVAISILKKMKNSEKEQSEITTDLALVYRREARYEDALRIYFTNLKIKERLHQNESPGMATIYNNIAVAYYWLDKCVQALHWHIQALKLRKKIFKTAHADLGETYNNIGVVFIRLSKFQIALKYLMKAMQIRNECLGSDHPEISMTYDNIASCYACMEKYDEAIAYFEKTLTIRINKMGENHVDTGATYNNMAYVYRHRNDKEDLKNPVVRKRRREDDKKAIEYYKKALKIFKYNYSKDHHQLRSVADNLYRMYLKTGDTKDAEDIKKEYFF